MNAKAPVLINATLRIRRVRLRNKDLCVVFGHRVDPENRLNDRFKTLVASIPASICDPQAPQTGEIWQVYGIASRIMRAIPDSDLAIHDTQIEAQQAELLRPSGSQLVQWLADNIDGIGSVKAQRLYDQLGDALYDALDAEDHYALSPLIPLEQIRLALFAKWLESGDAQTMRFVQQKRIPLPLARKVIKFHGKQTIGKLSDDPYRLLSFTGSWKLVDWLAREQFNIDLEDTRRLSAALEEALYMGLHRGHTFQPLDDLYSTVRRLLTPLDQPKRAFCKALLAGQDAGQFILSGSDENPMLHATGTWLQEKSVALFINKLLSDPEQQQRLFEVDVDAVLDGFERDEQSVLGTPDFHLDCAQRRAVETSFNNRLSVITGGAGVGKTTVLKALYRLLDHLGRPRYQMALSGRATARMIEATGEKATTIASFLKNYHYSGREGDPVVIIDEASMLDLHTMYQLSRKLPLSTHLILVGDPYQLPPIGAGLILHLLCQLPSIPCSELTVVRRQASDSAIPAIAKSVRDGEWPELSQDAESEVCFIPCHESQIQRLIMNLYEQDREHTQILGAVKRNGSSGTQDINYSCHSTYAAQRKQLHVHNSDTGEIESTRFSEGDLLLYTANNWQRGLQNGSLGKLLSVYESPQQVVISVKDDYGNEHDKPIRAIALAEFDGQQQYLTESDVDYLEHAYAITVHKAQGSQFERVIVPIRKSRVLDRTFLYTAITRAKQQVILLGDEAAARAAVEAPPNAFKRQVGLEAMLRASV
tara:strand:+ start:7137 stop:9422 length:2286 start_codon:yes stop_codon:yes gene_type:complete